MSINPLELRDKRVALVVWETPERGEDEGAVFLGLAKYDGTQLTLDFGENRPPFDVDDDWLSRVKPTTEGIQDILQGADYYLPLSIGSLPECVNPSDSGYLETGLIWPSAEKPEDS